MVLSRILEKNRKERNNMNKKMQAIILGVMCFLLTIGISLQVRTVESNGSTTSSNQKLNNLKTQVLKMKEKYEESYGKLEKIQQELENTRTNATSNDEKLKSLEEEIKKNNILLGATEVTGPGVTITVADATVSNTMSAFLNPRDLVVHDTDLLEIVNELKNAGAEAIEINGQRITGNTSILCDGNVIVINGEKISSTFVINAIGLPERLATLNRPGSYLKLKLEEENFIKTTLEKQKKVTVPKYISGTNYKYAKTVK